MADLSNIARPYALAAFEAARKKEQMPAWKGLLESASYVAKQPDVVSVLNNPEVLPSQLLELFESVLSAQLDTERQNFLHLLAQNKRLNALPEISAAFNDYYAQLKKISHVRVVTAITINEDFKQKLISALTKRFNQEVTLHCEVDPSILGGAIIYIGDNVIDGSILGKLTRLRESLLR